MQIDESKNDEVDWMNLNPNILPAYLTTGLIQKSLLWLYPNVLIAIGQQEFLTSKPL